MTIEHVGDSTNKKHVVTLTTTARSNIITLQDTVERQSWRCVSRPTEEVIRAEVQNVRSKHGTRSRFPIDLGMYITLHYITLPEKQRAFCEARCELGPQPHASTDWDSQREVAVVILVVET